MSVKFWFAYEIIFSPTTVFKKETCERCMCFVGKILDISFCFWVSNTTRGLNTALT